MIGEVSSPNDHRKSSGGGYDLGYAVWGDFDQEVDAGRYGSVETLRRLDSRGFTATTRVFTNNHAGSDWRESVCRGLGR
jgi:hypothetical protein